MINKFIAPIAHLQTLDPNPTKLMTIDLYMGDRMLHNEHYRKAANIEKNL